MYAERTTPTLEETYDDLQRRSLAKIPGDLARLIYLASTRDYNTGTYHHAGLAAHFRADLACAALELAHRRVFMQLAALSLEDLVRELEIYVGNARQTRGEVLDVWQKLEPYRVSLPLNVSAALAQLFVSNLRVALVILQRRPKARVQAASASSPRP